MYVWSCGCVFTETDRHKTFSAYKKKLATKAYNLVFFFCFFFFLSKMERNVVVSRRRKSEPLDGFDFLPSDSEEAHVLAVDDSLVDRKVIEQLLKISSFKVTAVDSGRRALQFLGLDEEKTTSVGFDGLKVDLIITDYCMPGMTGYELLKKIKESSNFREIPVVIMSSENILARIDRCLEEGAEDFIVKPVKLADVKRLKDYMMREDRFETDNNINKRKSCCDLTSSEPFISSSSSSSSSESPSREPISSSASVPSSPTPLDSPIRRLKMTTSE